MASLAGPTSLPRVVFRIVPAGHWAARGEGLDPSPLDAKDGYFHLSTAAQVPGTLERFFRGQDVVLLKLRTAAFPAGSLRFDHVPEIDQWFPHLYGFDRLPVGADHVEAVWTTGQPGLDAFLSDAAP